jgi:hypothetical protein
MNGKQIYTLLSGRDTFFDDLLKTVTFVFQKYNTLDELKSSLEIL